MTDQELNTIRTTAAEDARKDFEQYKDRPHRLLLMLVNARAELAVAIALNEEQTEKNEKLTVALEPGKASALVSGMWKVAEEAGMPHSSWKHALTWIREQLKERDSLRAEKERLEKQLQSLTERNEAATKLLEIAHGTIRNQLAFLHSKLVIDPSGREVVNKIKEFLTPQPANDGKEPNA